jgi:hypothetical protein
MNPSLIKGSFCVPELRNTQIKVLLRHSTSVFLYPGLKAGVIEIKPIQGFDSQGEIVGY